jgi:hypothetical protein
MTYDSFEDRWGFFCDCIRKDLFVDVPVYTAADWLTTFMPKMCPSESGFVMHGTHFRFINGRGGVVINELSLMIALVNLYLVTGTNWLAKLSLFVDIDIDTIDDYGGDIEDTYLRTFIYCMHFLAKKKNILKLDEPIFFETLYSSRLKGFSQRGLSYVYPKKNGYTSVEPNTFTNTCLLLNYNEPRVEVNPYKRSSNCIETFFFDRFCRVDMVEVQKNAHRCEHSMMSASEKVRKESSVGDVVLPPRGEDVMCVGADLQDILNVKDIETDILMENIHIDNEVKHDFTGEYHDSDDMTEWLKKVHSGSKKNLASFLFFIDKYKKLMELHPSAKVYFLGCGDSSWYQVIPTLLYDRHIVFIDKKIRRERMKVYPNVTLRYDFVYDVEEDFRNSILIMDMSRDENDRDLLDLMIRISSVSLCYMYKFRSSWYSQTTRIPGLDYIIPPFVHYGSSEVRVFGSKNDTGMLDMTLALKKKISRITKMRKTYSRCLDCVIFDDLVSKYLKLPQEWYYFTRREEDINVNLLRVSDVCNHHYSDGNVYLRGCKSCLCNFYQFVGPGLSRWMCPARNGKEHLAPTKKKDSGYTRDAYMNIKTLRALCERHFKT